MASWDLADGSVYFQAWAEREIIGGTGKKKSPSRV
jgi:hypothetical protein